MLSRPLKAMGHWILALLLLVVTVVIIKGLIAAVAWSNLDSGWAQAIGGILAFGAAVLIYAHQIERRKKDDYSLAVLGASKFQPAVRSIQHECKRITKLLGNEHAILNSGAPFVRAREILATPRNWQLSDVSALVPLPEGCAIRLAAAVGSMDIIERALDVRLANPKLVTDAAYRTRSAGNMLRMLREVERTLADVARVMESAIAEWDDR